MSANTDYSQTIPFMSFAELNAHQFALHFNSPNLMFAKCTAYTVYREIGTLMMLNFGES